MIDSTSADRPLAPRVLAFVGDDPGQKGATCLLGVLDDSAGDHHGEVVYCAVWDHALRQTDRGEHVDPVHFTEQVARHIFASGAMSIDAYTTGAAMKVARVVIEVPRVGGRMFSADGVVTQGANYGIVLAASLCSSEFRAEIVEDADPAGGQWQAEGGTPCPRGTDPKQHSVDVALRLLRSWGLPVGADCHVDDRVRIELPPNGITLARNDRADALRLAHLGVLRWLGHTVTAPNAGRTALTRKRVKTARDHEAVRAVDGIDAKALNAAAVARIGCPRCAVRAGDRCGKSTCRERVWAMAAGMKSPGLLAQSTDLAAFLEAMQGAAPGTAISCAQGVWRRVSDGCRGAKVSRAALDAAIDAGLVRLTLDAKRRPVWVTTFLEAPQTGVVLG